jgi:hypothetical protein
MFVAWIAVWIVLALLSEWLRTRACSLRRTVMCGALAAIGSGASFYLVSGIWRPFDPAGWDYAAHFGAWIAAYLPGFAAILLKMGADGKPT